MVSEFMLQQTPVARVEPVHRSWMEAWPTPADLAAAPSGEAVRAWGRLGYPRRALRLHAAAHAIVETYDGQVPSAYDDLRALPGVGDYTAAAIATFGFGKRHAVLDTNVRRVLARLVTGVELAAVAATAGEKRLAESLLPDDEAEAATWSIALMELGALVCTAAKPRCDACPVADRCAWRAAGYPAYDGPPRKAQTWAGTDRQCRGRLMAVVRDAEGAVPKHASTGPGTTPPNGSVPWPHWSATACSSGPATRRTPCPAEDLLDLGGSRAVVERALGLGAYGVEQRCHGLGRCGRGVRARARVDVLQQTEVAERVEVVLGGALEDAHQVGLGLLRERAPWRSASGARSRWVRAPAGSWAWARRRGSRSTSGRSPHPRTTRSAAAARPPGR